MEGYAGQQLIVYDDFDFPALSKYGIDPTALIIANGEWENEKVSVGPARFQQYYYPADQQRIVIIITNTFYDWFRSDRIDSRTALSFDFDNYHPNPPSDEDV